MAKFNSSTFNQLSGKVGGQVFRTTGNCMVVGGKSKGKVRNSYRASAWRSRFAFFSTYWRTLTESQRNSWNEAFEYGLSGFQLFCKFNNNRISGDVSIVGTIVSVYPRPRQLPALTITGFSINAGGSKSITIVVRAMNVGSWRFELMATQSLSIGISRIGTKYYKFVIRGTGNIASSTITFTSEYNAVFNPLVGQSGSAIFVRIRAVDDQTGRVTPWVYQKCLIS